MPATKITFTNESGIELAGLLETPDSTPEYYALFAHCFTCSKDLKAAARISRGLVNKGVAVLRFDFTGIGNSEGDFANTNFSSNLEDLVSAADYLKQEFSAPKMLIGHSLGGAAVLAVAQTIPSVEAIVTIGAPATARHLEHLLAEFKDDIEANDKAAINLGGQTFTVKKQFLQDLENHNTVEHIGELQQALLIFHSPVDEVVSIDEAARIYQAARHPKSFISLDKA
ncbi:MAG: alpha/beta hydrolase, partial [Gammaproteobacteria bacterium]